MEQILPIFHLLIALAIIGLIMLQQGKGAEMGASFGAGASQTLLGSAGSTNVLTRATAWLVAVFFATSFGLAMLATKQTRVSDDLDLALPAAVEEQVKAAPVADGELPQVDSDVPEASATDVPVTTEGDVPEL